MKYLHLIVCFITVKKAREIICSCDTSLLMIIIHTNRKIYYVQLTFTKNISIYILYRMINRIYRVNVIEKL